jgi:tetratricopeptide (TPR) repeat protein
VSASVAGLLAQARAAYQTGDLAASILHFRSAVETPSVSAAVLLEFADVLWADFDFEEALQVLEQAALREPSNPAPILLSAKRLFTLGRFADSARCLSTAMERQPEDHTLRRMLAELRDREGKLAEAEALAREALVNDPRDTLAVRSLAHTLRRAGRVEDAQEVLSRHLTEHPGPDDWRLNYELAACLDRRSDYAGAMTALQRAKAQLRPAAEPFLRQWRARSRRREEFARALDRTTLERWQALGKELQAVTPMAIMAGHPRSGTTLLEQMLAAHSGVASTDETGVLRTQFIEPIVLGAESARSALAEVDSFDAIQVEAGRAIYFKATAAHLGEAFGGRLLIEKDPLATQDLGLILRLLPECRVIFPLRDPRDVCVSFFFTLVPLNADSAPSLDLIETCASVALSLRLWSHWQRVMPQRWVQVRYEQLVREPDREMRSLADALDLPWEEAMRTPSNRDARGVRSPTYADVAAPLHSRAIGRWRNYAEFLEPVLPILTPLLEEFGYDS